MSGDSFKSFNVEEEFVQLRVEDRLYSIERRKLTYHPETLLGSNDLEPNDDVEYEIKGVNPQIFEGILGYYKDGLITLPEGVTLEQIEAACDLLKVPFNFDTVKDLGLFLRTQSCKSAIFRFYEEVAPKIAQILDKNFPRETEVCPTNSQIYIMSEMDQHKLSKIDLKSKYIILVKPETLQILKGDLNQERFIQEMCELTSWNRLGIYYVVENYQSEDTGDRIECIVFSFETSVYTGFKFPIKENP